MDVGNIKKKSHRRQADTRLYSPAFYQKRHKLFFKVWNEVNFYLHNFTS